MNSVFREELDFAGRKITLETGRLALQADGAVLATLGETMVLSTVVMGESKEEQGFLPLTVDYEERLYAGGRIKTSRFVKREGRPSEEAILSDRLIDRSVRPLFPKDFFNEVQVILTLLSVDQENDPIIPAMLATFAALHLSPISWNGPLGAVRVGFRDGTFLLNPRNGELQFSDLDLVMAGSREGIVMVEGFANELPEEQTIKALEFGQDKLQVLIEMIEKLKNRAGKHKMEVVKKEIETNVHEAIKAYITEKLPETVLAKTKVEREGTREEFLSELYAVFEGRASKAEMNSIFDVLLKKVVREKIIKEQRRPDGRRSSNEIRLLEIAVGVLPRTHGSALFQRGETQVLTTVTLGSTSLEQLIEGPAGEETKRYMHHYNFPPFSTGEVGRMGIPSRREIGHGALAEKALLPVIPSEEQFPYTIRLVSEVLSSSGSTSMGSVCGSTLSLMDAGVPIKNPVAGVAMGLVTGSDAFTVLTDIQELEDFYGDMDLKVAGSEKGITALQLDIKIPRLTHEILAAALQQAREGRLFILERMLAVLGKPREELSVYAPRITIVNIDPKKIGEVIGAGGKIIKAIQEETKTVIDIKEDGTVYIAGVTDEVCKLAAAKIEALVREVKVGEIFEGRVTRVLDFGAFVEVLPGKEGLVHVSELSPSFVRNIHDLVKVGDLMNVKVIEIDSQGRINLSKILAGPPSLTDRTQGVSRARPVTFRTPYHQRPGYRRR